MDLNSLKDTRRLAAMILELVPLNALLILSGPLGAGKTTLTQQLGLELGSKAHISSPSYTLIHEYPTPRGLLVHIDAYRLPSIEALLNLGLEDYLDRARLVVVEWGEELQKHYPEALVLELEFKNNMRRARLLKNGRDLLPGRKNKIEGESKKGKVKRGK